MKVAIYGCGQLGSNVAAILRGRRMVEVLGPFGRADRNAALGSGADVVVIATSSFLREIEGDLRLAVGSGSNVITSAEEAAFPWVVDPFLADEIDALAIHHGVTVVGGGLNPGFAFDALVAAAMGPSARVDSIRVERTVDLSGFGATVLRRIGIGYSAAEFSVGVASGRITGHIGFPQSMRIIARALGVQIDEIAREIRPLFAESDHDLPTLPISAGSTAGFEQRYVAMVEEESWFDALFIGHIALGSMELQPRDEIHVHGDPPLHYVVSPGFNAQSGSAAVVANSVRRVVEARPGWLTVVELPAAVPRDF